MHPAAREWVAQHATGTYGRVLEIGSRDINGGVRDLIDTNEYLGIDLCAGRGVDLIADVRHAPNDYGCWDLVICCEVLEHDPAPDDVIGMIGALLRPGGRAVCTAAGTGREPHSAVDGGPVRPGEHYGNLNESSFGVVWGVTLFSELVDGDWRVVWEKF